MSSHPAGEHAPGTGRKRVHPLVVVALVLLTVVVGLVLYANSGLDRSGVRAAVDATAQELEQTPVQGLGLSVFDIEEAATTANRGGGGKFARNAAADLRVKSAGEDSRGDLYEFTNSDGDHPICLAVRVDPDPGDQNPSFPRTSVSDGPC
ncbi:hypothetical protein [Plantactinospora sonchi]|uniref:Uncharacterized protein n=1 Tax=Plantactinospora sonchi TaxID=1544735 RepID=A0ABU7RXR5_9ACTN